MGTDKKAVVSVDADEMIFADATSVENVSVAELDLLDEILVTVVEDRVADIEVATRETVAVEEISSLDKITYEEYKCMTPLEKAQSYGFTRLRSYAAVEGVTKFKFMELGHAATVDEFMEETEFLYKGMRELVVMSKVEEVVETVEKCGLPFTCWTPREKAELL